MAPITICISLFCCFRRFQLKPVGARERETALLLDAYCLYVRRLATTLHGPDRGIDANESQFPPRTCLPLTLRNNCPQQS